MLITASEVTAIAFIGDNNVKPTYIKDSHIDVAEKKYIIPVIGQELYNNILLYPVLLDLIKKALAFYVRYIVLPDLAIQVTNTGMFNNSTDYSQSVSNEQRRALMQRALDNGDTYMEYVRLNIEENQYTEYDKKVRSQIIGGIVL